MKIPDFEPPVRMKRSSFVRAPMPKPIVSSASSFSEALDQSMGVRSEAKSTAASQIRKPDRTPEKRATQPVSLGRLGPEARTVSHLLIRHEVYGKRCWSIIKSELNRSKEYASIPAGSEVLIDPDTEEISWKRPGQEALAATPPKEEQAAALSSEIVQAGAREKLKDTPGSSSAEAAAPSAPLPEKFVRALRHYIGTPYRQLDCYELVVKGLEQLGLQYRGQDGLQAHLIAQARDSNLPLNAFLNGEGLIDSAGQVLYDRTFSLGGSRQSQHRKIWKELEPLLEPGSLISFSTRDSGHTGLIARREGKWTLINSGRMDHDLQSGRVSQRVGEEGLEQEINNWLSKARRSRGSLSIKLGRLDTTKMARFMRARSYSFRA